ncbi:MoxR family ATPase [Candidatus Woesearchaeota archaeon]|nr:MoxR family ATPase [Candidatus Woesearchaeota archaeon]
MRNEMGKIVIGQHEVINGVIRGLIANGHILVEGVPGIAKTLIIRTLAKVTGCLNNRIQFTVDLLPTDLTGITAYDKVKGFYTIKGPIFSNFIIADEINRSPPKTQSALLEAMQEKQVTISKETFHMMKPFFVMATQNPIETAGTYRLPEAQIDRFLFKVLITYPNFEQEKQILSTNMTLKEFDNYDIKSVTNSKEIIQMQEIAQKIYLSEEIEKYIVEIVMATRNPKDYNLKLGKYILYGSSPRASIGLFIASKCDALMAGKNYVVPQNVKNVAYDVLRHRILLTYEGQAENIKTEQIIEEILDKVPMP